MRERQKQRQQQQPVIPVLYRNTRRATPSRSRHARAWLGAIHPALRARLPALTYARSAYSPGARSQRRQSRPALLWDRRWPAGAVHATLAARAASPTNLRRLGPPARCACHRTGESLSGSVRGARNGCKWQERQVQGQERTWIRSRWKQGSEPRI